MVTRIDNRLKARAADAEVVWLVSLERLGGRASMPQAPNTSASSAATSSEAKIRKLEQQLSIVTAERNDLAADVEALCMQSSGDIFSASSVLGDRISHVQKEANKLQRQVTSLRTMRQRCSD